MNNTIIIYAIFPSLLFIHLLIKWLSKSKQPKLPPSPPKLPVLGNLHQLGLYPHRSLCSLAQRYGPLMLLKFGSRPTLIVSSPDAASEIMKTHDIIFSNRPRMSITDRLLYEGKDLSTAPYGEYWRQMKSICVVHLLSNKRVRSFGAEREEEVAMFIENIRESCSLSLPVNLSEMLVTLTNDVTCRVAFGKKYSAGSEGGREFQGLLGELMRLLGAFNLGDFIPWLAWVNRINGFDARVEKVAKEFDKFLDAIVEQHICSLKRESNGDGSVRGEDHRNNLVDVLLAIQKDNVTGVAIDRESIKALILVCSFSLSLSPSLNYIMNFFFNDYRFTNFQKKEKLFVIKWRMYSNMN
jgi:hypothetical protein